MTKYTYYKELPKEQKENFIKVDELTKLQKKMFEKMMIIPINAQIEIAKKTKNNEIPIEHFLKYKEEFNKYLREVINGVREV